MSLSLRPLLLAGLATLAVAGLTATTASAAAAVAPTSRPVLGDLTGDGVADQVTLGADAATAHATCSARLQTGLAAGGFSGGLYQALPVHGSQVLACPDLAVVVPGPTPADARLAVAWSSVAPVGGRTVQFFHWGNATRTWTYDGGTTGQTQPSYLTTEDVDGDGWGDLIETTDQGSGLAIFAGRDSTYTRVWTSAPSTYDDFAFADFDHQGGTDLVDAYSFFGSTHVGVSVVDGRTGAVKRLITDTSAYPATYVPQVVDVNHDGWADIRVKVFADDGSVSVVVFRNRANGTLAFTRV